MLIETLSDHNKININTSLTMPTKYVNCNPHCWCSKVFKRKKNMEAQYAGDHHSIMSTLFN